MKKYSLKMNFVICCLCILALLLLPNQTSAQAPGVLPAWPDFGGAAFKQMLEEISQTIKGTIKGALKTAAAEMIDNTIDAMISGGSTGDALFIQDWDDELFYKPLKETEVFLEGYLTSQLKGRSSDYISAARSDAQGILKNYGGYVKSFAKSGLGMENQEKKSVTYDVCKDPNNPLEQGNFRCLMQVGGQPMEVMLDAQLKASTYYMQQQKKAEVQAIAYQGYKSQKEGGYVTTPGSLIKEVQSDIKGLGNKIIAGAQDIPEIITAVVTKLVSATIKQGIGNAQRNIQREINRTISSVRSDITEQMKKAGPAAIFVPGY